MGNRSWKRSFGTQAAICAIALTLAVWTQNQLQHFSNPADAVPKLKRVPVRSGTELTEDAFANEFVRGGVPVLIKRYWEAEPEEARLDAEQWTFQKIKERFRDLNLRSGAAPYPDGVTSLGNVESLNGEIKIFQFGTLPASFAINRSGKCLPVFAIKYMYADYIHEDSSVACKLLEGVRIPSIVRNQAPVIPLGGLVAGGPGVETASHRHEAAINILIHGRKHWMIEGYEPFVQEAGDVIFIPTQFEHFVRNLEASVAWTFQFHENHFGTQVGVAEMTNVLESKLAESSSPTA